MGKSPKAIPFLLLHFLLAASWGALVPRPAIPSNATVFSHVYTIKLVGDGTENEGAASVPQEALGPPGSLQAGGLYEHTLEGPDQEHVVFTHRINLPSQTCGCPPGTEDTQDLLRRLQALENEVRTLRETCQAGGGCCPATASIQASTGQTDIRTLCSHHGSFDLSRCLCECEPGWSGPTCAEQSCPGGCGGPQRGKCLNGRCQCRPGYSGIRCEEPPSCPDDCNDQGRCVDGRCSCFQGYVGPSCADPACPQDCRGHGQCVSGRCVCDPGYTGPDCGTRACPNNCNQHGECRNGRCVCDPGYSGPDCATRACPNNCNQRGECRNGRCMCDPGYSGPDCATQACPNNCNQHGDCRNGRCVCNPGYSGPDCGSRVCPNNCNRRGECRDGLCICEQGYSGLDCATRACPNNCNQHGECRNGRCVCNPGYSGSDCGTRTCPSNCNRRGECRDGLCICEQGYSGPDCGTRTCPNNCNQHGECRNGRCVCNPGYSGPDCGARTCPSNCNRRGECRDGLCICEQGYSGPDCGTRTCLNNCNQRGECRNGRCVCNPGYSGPDCGTRTCPNNCNRRGKCRDGICVCDQGYSGLDCGTRACPNNCNQRGECRDGRCVCDVGFTGPACGTKSCPNDCSQRGRCLKGGVCSCHRGYTGPDCGQLACPEDCSGHGECQNGVCQCQEGYSGDDCSIEIPSIGIHVPRRDETSFRLEWSRPAIPVDGYEIHVVPTKDRRAGESIRLPGTETSIERTGLEPGEEYNVTIRAEKGQRYGPPVSQTVRTRVAPPQGLQALRVTGSNVTLQWDQPAIRPDGYNLSYVPVVAARPPQEPKYLELPAAPESITLKDLESNTRYRITLTAHKSGESSRPTSIITSTTAPAPSQPIRLNMTPSPSSQVKPGISSSGPEAGKPGIRPHPDRTPSNATLLASDRFLNHLVQNISAKLSPFRGTILDRLESYLRAINFRLRGDQTIESVARSIYIYLIKRKPLEFQEMVIGRLGWTDNSSPSRDVLFGEAESAFSDGYTRPDHAKPVVVASSPDSLEVSLDGVRGLSDNVVIRYYNRRNGEGRELVVPGDASTAVITGLAPGTTYQVEIHGVMKGHSSKSYSFVTATAPGSAPDSSAADTSRVVPGPTPTSGVTLRDLTVTDVSPNSFRVAWSAPPSSFHSFSLQYRDPKSNEPPTEIRVPGTERSVNVMGLSPSTEYELDLRGEKPNGIYSIPVTAKTSTAPEPMADRRKPSLGELTISEVTDNSARLSWDVPVGSFNSFLIQYKDAEGKPRSLPVEGDARETTISNLVPSRKYKFNLYGFVDRKRVGPVSAETVTAQVLKPTLGELSASNVTSDSVHLSWTVPSGSFDSFLLQYKDAEGRPQVLPMEGVSHEVTIPSLAPSRRYRFNLYGVSNRKRLGPITTDVVTGPRQEEPTPTPEPVLGDLSVSDATSKSVRLLWSVPVGSFDSFLLLYRDSKGYDQSLPVDRNSREVTVTNLVPSQRYRFNLYGISGPQHLGPVSVDAITAASQEPTEERPDKARVTQPSLGELSVSDVTSDSVRLSWTIPTGSFQSFLVQFKDSEGKLQAVPVEGGSREVTIPGLAPSHRYKFNLYGVSDRKRSGPISADVTTAATTASQDIQPTLGELSVSDVTSDSVRLSWTIPTGNFDSFLVQYKDVEGKPQALPVEGGAREVTVPNLAPSRRYKFNLYGVSDRKRSGPISTDATTATPTTPPEVTTEWVTTQSSLDQLSVSDVTSNSARLSWIVPTGNFNSFLVQYKDAEGKPQSLPVDGASRTLTIPNLEPSWRYKFNLYGVSEGKRLGPLSVEAVTAPSETDVLTPPSLGELSAFDVFSNSLRLSWSVATGSFDSFLIQYKDAEGRPQTLPVDGGSREVTVSNLVPSRRYKFNLFGVSGRKRIGPVSTDAVTGPPTEPPTSSLRLGKLSASNAMPNSLDLSWTVEAGNFDSFIIQYQDAQGKPRALPVDGDLRSLHIHDLAPAHRYQFNLFGLSGRKRLGPITTEGITAPEPTTPPPQPTLGELSVSDVTSDSAHLSWTVTSGSFDSFLIQYKDGKGKPQALPVEGGSHEVTIPNLAPSRRYKFNLYGVSDRKRLGPVSTETVTAPRPSPVPPSLGELSTSNITSDSVHLLWNVLTGSFDSFVVQYKDADGKPQALPVEGVFREVTVPNLVPSRKYKFNLYGITGRKRLGPVSTDATTAPAETQAPPTLGELSVSDVTSDSARLSWTVPKEDFNSFLIQYKDAEGKPQSLPLDGSARETTVSGLSPSRRYKFNLYGISGGKRHGPVSADTVTASTGEDRDKVKPSLGELSVSDITDSSVHLSWTTPTGNFDSFQIQYKDAEGKPQSFSVEGGSREVTVPNLTPSHRYKFNLYGVSNQKRLGPLSSEATTAAAEEEEEEDTEEEEEENGGSAPSLGELSISEATRDSVRLSWSVQSGDFDSFLIQYKDAEDKAQALPVDGGSREVTVPNLTPSHRYRFDLYGLSGGKHLGPVSIDAYTVPSTEGQEVKERTTTPPPQPNLGELSVSDVTSKSARLSWFVPVGTFDSFLIQYKDAEGKPQALPVDKETNSVVIYDLVPSHRYKFNLYGISGRRRFGPVSASSVTAKAERPEEQGEEEAVTPTTQPLLGELSVSEVTSSTAHLSWSVPVGSFDSFSVQYKDAEGKPQAIPVEGGSREVVVPNLAPSHKYRFNLYGTSGQQRLGPISASAVTAKAEPPAEQVVRKEEMVTPTTQPHLGELSVSEVTSSTAHLSWSVPVGSFDSFSVQYKDAEGKPQAIPVEGSSREVVVPNLAPSHKYRFNLYGISGQQRLGPISANAVTEASESEVEKPGAKAGDSVQPSLGDVTVSEITPDSLLLSWSIQEGSFESFLIQYKDAVGKLQVLPVDGAMRSLHLYNLTPSQRYKFNIYGVSGYKRLGPVSIDAVTAPETRPTIQPRLGDLSVSKVTSNSVSLSWSVPVGSFDSFLVQYKDAEGKPQVLPLNGDSRNVTVPSLVPSRRYKFNLYGIYGPKRLGPVSTDAVTGPGKTTPLKLGELLAQDITPESLLLSWTVESGNFDSFIIQYRDSDGKPHALPVDGGLRSLRLHDLTPSHKYRFNLYGVSGRKRLGPITTEATTADSKEQHPPQPALGELSASNITTTSVRLSWSVPSGNFASFSLHYRDAEGKPQVLPLNGTSREVVVSNLVPSRKFKFNLYGISGQKRFGPISTEAVTAQISKIPLKLGDLSISEVTKDSVRLSWTVSSGKFDSFLIQYKDAEGQPQTLPVDADSRTVVVSDLMSSHRYKFNLYGISGRKRFGPISIDAVTAFPEAISEPSTLLDNLVVSEVMPTTLQLTWEAPKEEFDSFLVRYKDSLLGSGRIPLPAKEVKVPGDERSAMIRGLTPNTEYSFTVYGIRNGSEVANINTVARTSGLELDSPRDLRFSDIRETSVVANWRPPSARIDRYKVSFQPSDGGEPSSINVDGSKLRTTIENLTPGTSYEVVVMSVRGFEESEPLVGYVTTVPDGPSDLRAVNVTDSSAVLTWQPAVAEMNNYIVTYGPAGGSRVSESVPGNRAQLQLSGLHLDTEYRASVYGEKEGNRSSPVSATFTTGADGPRDLQATEISPRSARLTWSPPRAPPGGYLLSYETPYGETKEVPLDASVTSYELQNLIPSSRYQVQVQALRRGTPTAPTSTSFTTGHLMYPFPRDCGEESQNGPGPSRVTTIYLGGNQDRPLKVYCDMETDGGGWIVFQRRMNGETDFWRDWQDYATGFGNLTREFWLGNDALHQLTASGDYELRVDLRAKNESVYATYQNFRVDPPADYYRLHLGSYSGTAGDAFSYHSGSVFSTRDRDPNRLIIPCAVSYRGAWWYRNCHYTNLNGLYANNRDHQGVNWFNWKGFEFSIPFTEMKLRPHGFQPSRRA